MSTLPKSSILRLGSVTAILAILFSALAFPAQKVQAASCTAYHTVKKGETLYTIGLKYNITWDKLAVWNNIANPNQIYAGQKLCVAMSGTSTKPSLKPTFTILAVAKGKEVTIKTSNFPAHQTFEVRMGKYGTLGVKGIYVGTVKTGSGGSLNYTFKIPKSLKDANRIAIRLESPTSGYYSYNWFYNVSTK